MEKIKIKSTKVIEIEGFIDAWEVHPTLYESPYFACPDGLVAAKTYSLLAQTLKTSGKVGIGKVALCDREEIVMLSPLDGGIVLYKLHNPRELRNRPVQGAENFGIIGPGMGERGIRFTEGVRSV